MSTVQTRTLRTIIEAARDQLAHLDETAGQAQAAGQFEAGQSLRNDALKLSVALNDYDDGREHWIARVKDSINGYTEVQSAYYDGTAQAAADYFTGRCDVIKRYTETEADRERYQIIMAANPVVIQDA